MPTPSSSRIFALLLLAALLSGCSDAYFWAINARAADVPVTTASYAPGADHQLDIYRSGRAEPAPVVVFFYGGSWQTGRRADYRFVGAALASHGVVTVIPDYRKSPRYPFPTFMRDAAEAVAWTRAHAAQFGGDPKRIFVMGHSAGAHIAVLLATDARYLRAVAMRPRDLAGAIGLAGPYDFLPITEPAIKTVFGAEKDWPLSQPVNYVDGDEPPFLLLHGTDDTRVRPANSEHLAAKLHAQHEPVELELLPDLGHIGMINGFASPRFSPALADSLRWIHSTAAGGGTSGGQKRKSPL